jgi:ribonucleotide reductase beta subunit family protein with ferritin-like domain
MTTKIQTPTVSFVTHYPEAIKFANEQLHITWFADEIKLEKDIQDVLVNMTEAERHGVITTLRLFTLYELFAGKEYWTGVAMKRFPRPEIARMCSVFGAFELGVHQPFYARLNELLNMNTDEFYLSYVDDPVLKARMDYIDKIINSDDKLLSTAVFSMLEGAILYSSFAFIKHFQVNGKNKLLNTVRGVNFSAVDENLHNLGGSWIFQQAKHELKEAGLLSEKQEAKLQKDIIAAAHELFGHEERIADMTFEKGDIPGITAVQMKHFTQSRLNICMANLGYSKIFDVKYDPITDWFYNGFNNYQMIDFFTGVGREYSRNWDEQGFVWETE